MTIDSTVERTRRNLRVFKEHFPEVYDTLSLIAEPQSVVQFEDGVPVNILAADMPIYPAPAPDWTQGQMIGFQADPPRLVFGSINHCNPSEITFKFNQALRGVIERVGGQGIAGAPVVDSGYAFVYGIGLGYHLEQLVATLNIRNLILIEPMAEFIHHSMLVVDWEALFAKADERGIAIHFITDPDPKRAAREIETKLLDLGAFFIEGSYFYYHYYSWALSEVNSTLMLGVQHHAYSTGFFEDECLMMKQSMGNIFRGGFRVIESKPVVEQNIPVFIVASGPSLDNDLDAIKQWRSKVILISCGTTLSILLANGLRPDIHVEVENSERTPEHIGKAAAKYGSLKDIILVGSLTVDPRAVDYFGEAWLFFRPALSPTKIFSGPHRPFYGAEPVVANAGLAVALTGGFRRVYMFGVDCGNRVNSKVHHAKDSIYYNDDAFDLGDIEKTYDRLRPGNFGGMFRANYALDMGARGLSELKRHYTRVQLFNCSDGARIDGAKPFSSEAIDLSADLVDPKVGLEKLRNQWEYYGPNQLFRYCSREELIRGCGVFETEVRRILGEVRSSESFYDAVHAYDAAVRDLPPECLGVSSIVGPSLSSMLRIGAYFGTRLKDPQDRCDMLEAAVDGVLPLLSEMTECSKTIFEQIKDVDTVSCA